MNLLPMAVTWGILASVVLVLAFYRASVAKKQDEYLHVNVDVASKQVSGTQKLQQIDRWGKLLTVVAALFGLALLGLVLFNAWQNPPQAN